MLFSLDIRRARKGDCLLLHFGAKDHPGLVMIDGGPKSVYTPHLKPRLKAIRKSRKLGKNDSLPVDVLMISHVDDDHIQGILDLTREEVRSKRDRRARMLNVLSLWHNSFNSVIRAKPKELTASLKKQFGEAAVSGGGELSGGKKAEVEDDYLSANPGVEPGEARELVGSTLKVLASIAQGFRLRSDAKFLGIPPNAEFNGKLIIARNGSKPIPIAQGLKFTVVGPMQPELEKLHVKHQEWLKGLKKKGKKPTETLAAYVDRSVPNLSSIVVMAELKGKRMLLTGDARGDKILEGLQLVGLLGPGSRSKIKVDLLKVPHHGSARNLDDDFFERIVAKHYVFSGNGEHGNPEREALEMLLNARGENAAYSIHLTYPFKQLDVERKKDWRKGQASEKKRKKKDPEVQVRENWSPAKHSLASLFKVHPKFARKVKVVDAKKPHLVDLLDPVGF